MTAVLLALALLLAQTTAPAGSAARDDLVGTWAVEGGSTIEFRRDGTGVDTATDGGETPFAFDSDARGVVDLTGEGMTTRYRYVTDGRSLLLGVPEEWLWITGRRLGPGVDIDTLPPPFSDGEEMTGGIDLAELDSFMEPEQAADTEPTPASVAGGVWAGRAVTPTGLIGDQLLVLAARPDGRARTVFGNSRGGLVSQPLTLTDGADGELNGQLITHEPPRGGEVQTVPVRLVLTGETALFLSVVPAGRPRLDSPADAAVVLFRSELAPSDAVRQHLLGQPPATRPAAAD